MPVGQAGVGPRRVGQFAGFGGEVQGQVAADPAQEQPIADSFCARPITVLAKFTAKGPDEGSARIARQTRASRHSSLEGMSGSSSDLALGLAAASFFNSSIRPRIKGSTSLDRPAATEARIKRVRAFSTFADRPPSASAIKLVELAGLAGRVDQEGHRRDHAVEADVGHRAEPAWDRLVLGDEGAQETDRLPRGRRHRPGLEQGVRSLAGRARTRRMARPRVGRSRGLVAVIPRASGRRRTGRGCPRRRPPGRPWRTRRRRAPGSLADVERSSPPRNGSPAPASRPCRP